LHGRHRLKQLDELAGDAGQDIHVAANTFVAEKPIARGGYSRESRLRAIRI
jgi:hypothetical protein